MSGCKLSQRPRLMVDHVQRINSEATRCPDADQLVRLFVMSFDTPKQNYRFIQDLLNRSACIILVQGHRSGILGLVSMKRTQNIFQYLQLLPGRRNRLTGDLIILKT